VYTIAIIRCLLQQTLRQYLRNPALWLPSRWLSITARLQCAGASKKPHVTALCCSPKNSTLAKIHDSRSRGAVSALWQLQLISSGPAHNLERQIHFIQLNFNELSDRIPPLFYRVVSMGTVLSVRCRLLFRTGTPNLGYPRRTFANLTGYVTVSNETECTFTVLKIERFYWKFSEFLIFCSAFLL